MQNKTGTKRVLFCVSYFSKSFDYQCSVMYFDVLFGFGDVIYTCVYKKKAVPLRRFYIYK